MNDQILHEKFEITGRDIDNAGKASTRIKQTLKKIGIDPAVIRRIGIACYESEMNIVMYADRGTMEITITPKSIRLEVKDKGQGINDIQQAMQEGFSTASDEMRNLGFGAGMGLPNIKRNSDFFEIDSIPGKGTELKVEINLK